MSLDQHKHRLRAEAKTRRDAAAAALDQAGRDLCRAVLAVLDGGRIDLPPEAAVSAYWPKGAEIDPRPTIAALQDRGHEVGLPVMDGGDRPLVFRRWRQGEPLHPVGYGLLEPGADAPVLTPRLLLVPLLAFDRRGVRLGYGGGYYDRTLADLRARGSAVAVGLAYSVQELPEVPHHQADQRMDWVVTESETIAAGAA